MKNFLKIKLPTLIAITISIVFCLSCKGENETDILKIGLAEEPRTLNVWLASDANSKKILSQIYQPLYMSEPATQKLIPWLAKEHPVYNPETISYTVTLRKAKWSDGTDLTSNDVVFTANIIKDFRVPLYASKWDFVKKVEIIDKQTVRFYLTKPMAIFLTRTLTGPVVQKKEWEKIVQFAKKKEKPLKTLLNHKIEKPVGSGPFVLKEWRKGAYLYLKKNTYFFGQGIIISGFKLGPYLNGIIFKTFGTSDVAILALKKGTIDMFWKGIQPGYLADLQQNSDIRIFFSEKSALYFMGFNLRKPPFNDINLRRAVAAVIDRDFIVSRILQNYGTKLFSIVPLENKFWCCQDVDHYCESHPRDKRILLAYKTLRNAGYTWKISPVNLDGNIVEGKGIKLPNGNPMERFTILTPPADYDPHRAMSGMIIQEWLRDLGIPAYSRPMSFGSLIQTVKAKHNFQAFILGYGKLSLDPDYVRVFFHSKNDKPRGWNMSGYRNSCFDRLADQSKTVIDPNQRKKLLFKMQKMISRDLPYIPLYTPKLIEAVRKGKFTGWVEMQNGIGNIWSFCMVKPDHQTKKSF
ncbi:MAG TPA: ABC transporter substrate-binding protein [Desulfobacteraceae bacterium]|nr:ABC transporter substrate-binding protein [Desulfobacteraceae bacterium]